MPNLTKIIALAVIASLGVLPLQSHAGGGDPYGFTRAIMGDNLTLNDLLMGQEIYIARCGKCHSNPDSDAPQLGNAASWAKRVPEFTAVLDGHVRKGFLGMPSRGGYWYLRDRELALAVNFLIKARIPQRMPLLSEAITQGREVYHFNCATCHDTGREGAPRIGDTKAWEKRTLEWMPLLVDHVRDGFLRMPRRGAREGLTGLTDEDLRAAIVYMLSWSRVYPPTNFTIGNTE